MKPEQRARAEQDGCTSPAAPVGEDRAPDKPRRTRQSAPARKPPRHGLEDEIELLRWAVRRLYALAQEQDNGEAVKTLAALSAAATRLARLVQTQAQVYGAAESGRDALLAQALAEVSEELGL